MGYAIIKLINIMYLIMYMCENTVFGNVSVDINDLETVISESYNSESDYIII